MSGERAFGKCRETAANSWKCKHLACAPPVGSDLAKVQNGKSRQVPGLEGLSVKPERAEGR